MFSSCSWWLYFAPINQLIVVQLLQRFITHDVFCSIILPIKKWFCWKNIPSFHTVFRREVGIIRNIAEILSAVQFPQWVSYSQPVKRTKEDWLWFFFLIIFGLIRFTRSLELMRKGVIKWLFSGIDWRRKLSRRSSQSNLTKKTELISYDMWGCCR